MNWRKSAVAALSVALAATAGAKVAPFRDGETVVFLGDSITHGGRYVADLQLYWSLRHPGSAVKLHNAGICGQRANHGLIRYDWDVAPLKPDRVFILFGMNDVARDDRWAPPDTPEKLKRRAELTHTYVTNLTALVRKVRVSGAVPVVMTPTPFDQYSDIPKADRCPGTDDPGLKSFAAKAREVAASEGVECVELYAELLPILKANPGKVFLKDRVHPGHEGHLLMAALILKAMGEDGTADVTAFDASSGARKFAYAPKRLPYPTCAEYAVADSVMPLTEGWNRETVRITGLPEGRWTLRLGGTDFGVYSAAALAAGVNVTVTNETRFSPSLKAAKRAWAEMSAFHSEQNALRVLAQTFCQVRRLGGDINSLDSCLEKYNEWIEVYRQKPETMQYYTYYGNQIPAFKKKYVDRENALKRIEKHRAAMAAMRAEPYEISVERPPSDAVDAAYAYYLDEPERVWADDASFIAAVFGADFVNDPPVESVVFSHCNTGDETRDVAAMETVRAEMKPGDVLVSALSNGCVYARFVAGDVYGTRHCRILGPVAGDGRLWESDAGSQLFNRREVGGYCLAGGTRGTRSFRLVRPLLSDRVRVSPRRNHPTGVREPDADARVDALAETAYAYYLKGALAQYDSVPLVPDEKVFYRWSRKFDRTPIEEATADKTYYAVCSAFVQGVYFNALGQDYDYPEPVTYSFMEMSPKETVVFSYDAKDSRMSVDAAVARVRELVRPGDIITGSNYPKGGGHVMLCYGRVDGRLKLIHASGNKYDMATGVDSIESEGTVYFDDLEAALFVKGHYVDLSHYSRFALIRPLVDGTIRLTPTAEARLRHPGLRYDRRVTGGVHGSVIRGGKIDYTTVLENHSDRAYDVEVVEGDFRQTILLGAGAAKTIVRSVVVDAPVGAYYARPASAGGIPGNKLETQVVARRWSVDEAFAWAEKNLTDRSAAPQNRVRGWFGGRDCREGEPATRLRETRSCDLMPGDVVLSYDAKGVRRIWVKGDRTLLEKCGGEIRPVPESRVTALLSLPFFAAYRER